MASLQSRLFLRTSPSSTPSSTPSFPPSISKPSSRARFLRIPSTTFLSKNLIAHQFNKSSNHKASPSTRSSTCVKRTSSALVTDGDLRVVPEIAEIDQMGGKEVAEGVWLFTQSLGFSALGLDPFLHMAAIQLPDGSLWIHNPVNLTPEIASRLETLGPVKHVVLGNNSPEHGFFTRQFSKAFPEATIYATVPLKKLPISTRWGLKEVEVLGDEAPQAWGGVIDQVMVDMREQMGFPVECLFCHRPTGSLLSSDAFFYADDTMVKFPFNRWSMELVGFYKKVGGIFPQFAGIKKDSPVTLAVKDALTNWEYDILLNGHTVSPVSNGKALVKEALGLGSS